MSNDLQVLVENKDALLLAEMAAWLHDMGKCSDEFLENKNRSERVKIFNGKIEPYKALISPENIGKYNFGTYHKLREAEVNHDYALHKILGKEITAQIYEDTIKFRSGYLEGEKYPVAEIIHFGRPLFIDKMKPLIKERKSEPIEYLGRAHAAAHIEKEESKSQEEGKFLSSPFGYELEKYHSLTNKLENLPFLCLKNPSEERTTFLEGMKKVFKNAPGETRRPTNEVDLWSWSGIVAALYKAALAGALLGHKPSPNDLRWRLLAVRLDAARILDSADSIPVLLTRKEWITGGFDNVRKLLEETYPLGNEIYRDENGSVFVVPDLEGLLDITDSKLEKSLKEMITEALGYDGEITVTPEISDNWWGQDPDRKNDEIPPIGNILQESPYSPPDIKEMKKQWDKAHGSPEICTVSCLRPRGEKTGHLKASDYWAEKIRGRAKRWMDNRTTTIWIDEVADRNGRICLFTGKFGLSKWLTSDEHILSLAVNSPGTKTDPGRKSDPNKNVITKNPSFARLRRIWETTQQFWEEIEADFPGVTGQMNSRLVISGTFESDTGYKKPNEAQAYNVVSDEASFTVFFSGEKYFIIENLTRLSGKLTQKEKGDARDQIQTFLTGKRVEIRESIGGGKRIGYLTIKNISEDKTEYTPVIPIVSDPDTFMVIIPADRAVEVARKVKEKYEAEMGKVRSKLPLTLGLVFAGSHTPLAALMDAGRRMLNRGEREECWVLADDAHTCDDYHLLSFTNGVTWQVQGKMGDRKTDDDWYPYFYVQGKPPENSRWFKHPKSHIYLVHARDLTNGTGVTVCQSTFDFEFLDTSSRRWEVDYDAKGQRRQRAKSTRPYLLDEIDDFERIWTLLAENLTSTQIRRVIDLIETKRTGWPCCDEGEVLEEFAHVVLKNAKWSAKAPAEIPILGQAAASGMLRDVTELYMQILKKKSMEKKND